MSSVGVGDSYCEGMPEKRSAEESPNSYSDQEHSEHDSVHAVPPTDRRISENDQLVGDEQAKDKELNKETDRAVIQEKPESANYNEGNEGSKKEQTCSETSRKVDPDSIKENDCSTEEASACSSPKDSGEVKGEARKTFTMEEDEQRQTEEDGWIDVFGSGDFKKRVIKPGNGERVCAKNIVTLTFTCYEDKTNKLIEKVENFEFIVGDLDVVKGIDLAVPMMEHGETAEIIVPSRLAYGKTGRPPEIPPNCDLRYEVEILKAEELDEETLAPEQAMKYGNQKRDRGNFWYGHGDYISAIHCYKRAAEFLDNIHDGSDCPSDVLQEILDTRIKVNNNMAAAHLKMESYDQALKCVDFVLKIQSNNVKAHFRKAKILAAKGLTDEAVVSLKKAAELEPETKVIQQELQRLLKRRQVEHKTQKEMYKRMFPQSSNKDAPSRLKKWVKHWSVMAGSCLALAIGVAAYRQYYS